MNSGYLPSGGASSSLSSGNDYAFNLAELLSNNVTLTYLTDTGSNSTSGSGTATTSNQIYTLAHNTINAISSYINNGGYENIATLDVREWFEKVNNISWLGADNDGGTLDEYDALVAKAENATHKNEGDHDADDPSPLVLTLVNFIDGLAKSMYNLFIPDTDSGTAGVQASPHDMAAFSHAFANLLRRLDPGTNEDDSNHVEVIADGSWDSVTLENQNKAQEYANSYNCWVRYYGAYGLSLSNLAEAFLTEFLDGMDDYSNNCAIARKATESSYITDNLNYLYTINLPESEDTLQPCWQAEFYSIIFNNICASGWYENQRLNDNAYLNNAIKNGQLFITSLNEQDNNYYQTRYAQVHGGHIIEETDEDAVAQAEREYTYVKNRINYKEQRIEIETKSVDAELLSLNTEYETVKNLISKNIDNTFKQFQS